MKSLTLNAKMQSATHQLSLFDSTNDESDTLENSIASEQNTVIRKNSGVIIDMQLRRSEVRDREFIRRTKDEVRRYDFA